MRGWGAAARQPHTLLLRRIDHSKGGVAVRDLPPRRCLLISQHRGNIRHTDGTCEGIHHGRIAFDPPVKAPPTAQIIKMLQRLQPMTAPHDRICTKG